MKDLKTILEASVLGDIEDTIASMDKYDAMIKKAETDWKKLLKSRRFMHLVGDTWCIKLKSPELIEYLGQGHPSYEKYKDIITQVMIFYHKNGGISMDNNTKLSKEQLMKLISDFKNSSSEDKVDPDKFIKERLSKEQAEKVKSVLQDPAKLKEILFSKKAADLLEMLKGDKKNES